MTAPFNTTNCSVPAQKLACLCDSEEWQSGELTGTVLATLEDYLEEYEHYVLPAFFKRCGRGSEHHRRRAASPSFMPFSATHDTQRSS